MYYLNKIAWLLLNPLTFVLVLLVLAFIWKRLARLFIALSFVWLIAWSLSITSRPLANGLESCYEEQRFLKPEEYPTADAIVLLGGGVSYVEGQWLFPHLMQSASRNWQAARLYKAGRAPYVIPSGTGAKEADAPFLRDLGVPEEAILVENDARNTEENIKFTLRLLKEKFPEKAHPKVLVVTSAWHMRRAEILCRRYAPELEVVPAASDFMSRPAVPVEAREFYPSVDAFNWNATFWKEYLGIVRYGSFAPKTKN